MVFATTCRLEIESLDQANVAIDVRVRACEPSLLDSLLAGIVGGGDKPQFAFELPTQIRKVRHPSANVFFDSESVGYAEGERCRRRELDEPCRTLRGNHVGMPSRFDVDYRFHEFEGDVVCSRVVIGPAHLDIEHCGRRSRLAPRLNCPGGTA